MKNIFSIIKDSDSMIEILNQKSVSRNSSILRQTNRTHIKNKGQIRLKSYRSYFWFFRKDLNNVWLSILEGIILKFINNLKIYAIGIKVFKSAVDLWLSCQNARSIISKNSLNYKKISQYLKYLGLEPRIIYKNATLAPVWRYWL